MTHISFYKDSQDKLVLRAGGHAGYAPFGQDIVCSAVSALVFGLGVAASGCDGFSFLTYPPNNCIEVSASATDSKAVILFQGFLDALAALAASEPYNQYVSLDVDARE